MKNIPLIVLFFTLLTTSSAQAYYLTPENECTPVDLRQSFQLKMRDQKETSWCYAEAASDYLQYAYNVPEQISAMDIVVNYSQTRISKFISFFYGIGSREDRFIPANTGFIKIAVNKTLSNGYCPESSLPSDEWTKVTVSSATSQNQSTQSTSKMEITQSIRETFELQKKIKNGLITTADKMPWYFKFKNINQQQFFDLLKTSTQKNLMINVRDAACKADRKPFPGEFFASDFQVRSKRIFQNMNYNLDQKMPVTVDFFSDVLRHFDNPKLRIQNLHTVLVYGRKYNSERQQCEYLLKDSYGEQCTKYDKKIACENGYLWMPENKLFHTMTSQLVLY